MKPIVRQSTLVSFANNYGVFGLLAILFGTLLGAGAHNPFFLFATLAILISLLTRSLWIYYTIQNRLQHRSDEMRALAAERGWQFATESEIAVLAPEFKDASIKYLTKTASWFDNFMQSPKWSYADLTYYTYQQTKYGEYKDARIFYSVMAMKLPRTMPHVLFDSHSSRKRQFKELYDKDQLYQLEGNFKDYFDTYFVKQYDIDSLSFITPEVMEDIIAASDYDIEIVDDQLIFYGPLNDMPGQIDDMAAKLAKVYDGLMNNIKTYDDDRLPYAQGKQTVTPLGMQLKRRKEYGWIYLLVMITGVVIYQIAAYIYRLHHK